MRLRTFSILAAAIAGPGPLAGQQDDAARFVEAVVAGHRGIAAEALALRRDSLAASRTRRLHLPALSVEAQWVELRGGADVGALVNPAFAALNELTGTSRFPTDVSFRFPLRQDARLRLAMPLFDDAIAAAVGSAEAGQAAQAARLGAAERDVRAAARAGLIRHAAAADVVRLREAVLEALDEQLRAAERRVDAGVDVPDVLLRARADRNEGVQRLLEATRVRDAARRALNRLALRPLDAPVPLVTDSAFAIALPDTRAAALEAAGDRAEVRAADAAVRQAEAGRRSARSAALPTVSVAIDLGWQGDRWRFTGDQDFTQLTVQGRWSLFTFGRTSRRRAEARLDAERAALARDDVRDQAALEIAEAWDALLVSVAARTPAEDRAVAAERTLSLVRRRWDEGLASHLELVSARAAATAAAIETVLARYQVAEARIALARATAAYHDEGGTGS